MNSMASTTYGNKVRLRHVVRRELNSEQKQVLQNASIVNFIPMEAIGERGELNLSIVRAKEEVTTGYTLFFENDVLIAKITPCFENGKGAVARRLLNGVGFGTTELHVLSPLPEIDPDFLYYITVSEPFRRCGEAYMSGAAGQKRVPTEYVSNYLIQLPSLSEQRSLAHYLDRQTAKIDDLITAKQCLLELLAEKRRALITHAVTRGLNPAAPLRDSGIEFVEKIPEHWEVINLKFLGEVRTGVAKGRDLGNRETVHVPYLRVANVQDGYIDLSDVADIQVLPEEISSFSLRKGDVLMNEGGDADKLGRGAVWDGSIEPCLHQNHVFAVRCYSIEPNWLTTVTGSDYAKAYFESRSKQSTNLASISATNISELSVVVPPQQERIKIINYLEQAISKIDTLRLAAKNTIELLHERRVALISAAVTGQIRIPT